jgi:hypothetical protein
MLRKRNEAKRKSIAATLMRDIQGTAAEKLAMFQKMRAAGGFANEDPAELAKTEDTLRKFAVAKTSNDGADEIDNRYFPLASADKPEVEAVIELVKTKLQGMDPHTLRCASSVLLALSRLPLVTVGIVATVAFKKRDGACFEWADIKISDYEFKLTIGHHKCDSGDGGDTTSDALFEAEAGGRRTGSIHRWLEVATRIAENGSVSGDDRSQLDEFYCNGAEMSPEWRR